MKKYRLVSYLQKSSSPRILKCLNCRNEPLYLAYVITLLFMRKKHTHPHLVNSFSHCQIHKRKCQAEKENSGKRLARLLNAQEQLLHLQRTSFQHPRGGTQSSTVPFLRHLTPSQASTVIRHLYGSHTQGQVDAYTHKIKSKLFSTPQENE